MSCSTVDLKAYFLGEVSPTEKVSVENHVRACDGCREELDRLGLTQAALLSLEDEPIPQRIAFVSDKVFEPRWWQTMWRSGPAMGFASAALLAGAILVHAYARPAAAPAMAQVDTTQMEQRVEREVGARLDSAVTKAVNESEARQNDKFERVLVSAQKRYEFQRNADLAATQQTVRYYNQQMARFLVAANNDVRPGQ